MTLIMMTSRIAPGAPTAKTLAAASAAVLPASGKRIITAITMVFAITVTLMAMDRQLMATSRMRLWKLPASLCCTPAPQPWRRLKLVTVTQRAKAFQLPPAPPSLRPHHRHLPFVAVDPAPLRRGPHLRALHVAAITATITTMMRALIMAAAVHSCLRCITARPGRQSSSSVHSEVVVLQQLPTPASAQDLAVAARTPRGGHVSCSLRCQLLTSMQRHWLVPPQA